MVSSWRLFANAALKKLGEIERTEDLLRLQRLHRQRKEALCKALDEEQFLKEFENWICISCGRCKRPFTASRREDMGVTLLRLKVLTFTEHNASGKALENSDVWKDLIIPVWCSSCRSGGQTVNVDVRALTRALQPVLDALPASI